jgi:hypothetical protein
MVVVPVVVTTAVVQMAVAEGLMVVDTADIVMAGVTHVFLTIAHVRLRR